MADLFHDFIQNPDAEHYRAVWTAFVASPHYQPYSRDLSELGKLHEAGDYEALEREARARMPRLLLTPRLHLFLALACEKRGAKDAAGVGRFICHALVGAILATGDGTEERPCLVTRVEDEYDVLMAKDLKVSQQALVQHGDRLLDRITLTDGRTLCFDLTEPQRWLQRQHAGGSSGGPPAP